MYDKLRQHVALLGLIGIALAISVGIASGIGDQTPEFAPLRTVERSAPALAPARRDVGAPNGGLSEAFTSIAAAVTPGVVRIETQHIPQQRSRLLGGMRRLLNDSLAVDPVPELSGGSGFIVSADGYVVTNNHVVEDADVISVVLYDKRVLPARLVGRDPLTDVALLKVDARDLPALRFGDSDRAALGEWVVAIGNPGFDQGSLLDFTVTSGIISAKGRSLDVLTAGEDNPAARYAIEDFLQTDAAINPGNSGGPLLNLAGEVIGMNTAIASSTGFNQGYAFAIPANLVERVIKDLAEFGHVRRPLLGVQIQTVTEEDAEVYGLPEISGVLIEDFSEDSPARRAGLQRGDVIARIDDKKVERVGQLQGLIAQHRPGETIKALVYRDGAARTFMIQLDQAPLPEFEPAKEPQRAAQGPGRLGIQVVELTRELARQLGFDNAGGAVITDVQPLSAADRKRVAPPLRIMAINGTAVRSARDAQSLLRGLRSGQIVSLTLQNPDGTTAIRNIRVP